MKLNLISLYIINRTTNNDHQTDFLYIFDYLQHTQLNSYVICMYELDL